MKLGAELLGYAPVGSLADEDVVEAKRSALRGAGSPCWRARAGGGRVRGARPRAAARRSRPAALLSRRRPPAPARRVPRVPAGRGARRGQHGCCGGGQPRRRNAPPRPASRAAARGRGGCPLPSRRSSLELPRRWPSGPRRPSTSVSESSCDSGRSSVVVAQPGGCSRGGSGRARQRASTGASCVSAARYRTRSRKVGSPQWTSSKTSRSGRSCAQRLEGLINAQNDSSRARPGSPAATAAAIPAAIASRSGSSGRRSRSAARVCVARSLQDDLPQGPVGHPLAV